MVHCRIVQGGARSLIRPGIWVTLLVEVMEDDKAVSSEGQRRRVLAVSAGASHTVALLCKWNLLLHLHF